MAEKRHLHLKLRRTGGILGGAALEADVAGEELDEPERETVRHALDAADLEGLAARSPIAGTGADRYQYELQLERGEERRRIIVGESEVPEELRPVVRMLERRALGQGARGPKLE